MLCFAMTPVVSSVIAAIGYDAHAATLVVALHSGRTYAYAGVAKGVHAAFLAAPSKGAFFNAEIRDAYAYERVR